MDARDRQPKYPYYVAGALLLVGLGLATLIYLKADAEPADIPWELTPESKKYQGALKLYGGTMNVLWVELTDWLAGLWHGRSLAYTIAVLSVVVAVGYLLIAWYLALPPLEGDDQGNGDDGHGQGG
ncbi:MAG: hypothetical protein ABSB49_11905 [Polyangia bacterium]|jgi:hypothetical protein